MKKELKNIIPHPIKFGRWLLKNATPAWDGGFLTWKAYGKLKDTEELFEDFLKETDSCDNEKNT